MRWNTIILGFALICFISTTTAAAQNTTLAWDWTPGKILKYRHTQEMTQIVTGEGMDQHTQWVVSYEIRQEVKSVDDEGIATVEQTYDAGHIIADERGGERIEFDSKNTADAQKADHRLIAPYAAFIGQTITFKVGSEGKVHHLEGAQQIIDKVMVALSKSNPLLGPLMAAAGGGASDEQVRAALEQQLRVCPDHSVKKRGSWDVISEQKFGMIGTVRNELTYKLDKVLRRGSSSMAVLGVSGELTQPQNAAGGGGGGASGGGLGGMLDIKLKDSKITGEVQFSVEQGHIIRSVLDVQTNWSLGISGFAGDMVLDHSFNQKGTLELVSATGGR